MWTEGAVSGPNLGPSADFLCRGVDGAGGPTIKSILARTRTDHVSAMPNGARTSWTQHGKEASGIFQTWDFSFEIFQTYIHTYIQTGQMERAVVL